MVWPRQKDAAGENTKINHGMDTAGEKERGRPRQTWIEGVKAAMTARNLEPDQWRNREDGVWFPEDGDSCYKPDRQIT
jgi:hypothetical protein